MKNALKSLLVASLLCIWAAPHMWALVVRGGNEPLETERTNDRRVEDRDQNRDRDRVGATGRGTCAGITRAN